MVAEFEVSSSRFQVVVGVRGQLSEVMDQRTRTNGRNGGGLFGGSGVRNGSLQNANCKMQIGFGGGRDGRRATRARRIEARINALG